MVKTLDVRQQRRNRVWRPQPRQALAIACPIEEIFFGGARGGGKSDWLLGDWLAYAETYQADARGILFRKSYPELEEILVRSMEIYKPLGWEFRVQSRMWISPEGALFKLRFLENIKDASIYQGHRYSWIGFDEIGNWADPRPIDMLRGCLRSPSGIPKRWNSTGNPGGVGHNWNKRRYIDPAPPMAPFDVKDDHGKVLGRAVYIPSRLQDNALLSLNDPDYIDNLKRVGSPELVRAWLEGDWDVTFGGAIDDVWDRRVHIIAPFEIPKTWRVDRSFDWGSSKPFAVCWWAESDGSRVEVEKGVFRTFPPGTVFLIHELYGWNGKPNEGNRMLATEVARKIKEIEKNLPYQVHPGAADTSIFERNNNMCIADDMASIGIRWLEANKSPGSRVTGLETLRRYLKSSLQNPMEEPGLFVFHTCRHFIRTIPTLPRDNDRIDDVDTNSEDHIYDAVRYRLSTKKSITKRMEISL